MAYVNEKIFLKNASIVYRMIGIIFCFFAFSFLFAQSPLNKIIDFQTSQTSIADALIELSEAADISIAFHPQLFRQDHLVNIRAKEESVQSILSKCLINTKVNFKLKGNYILLYKRKPRFFSINGYIEDAKSGERLVAASVWDIHSGRGCITNDYGFFSLKLPEGKVELQSSYLGYQATNHKITLNKNKNLNISLSPTLVLKEIIITDKHLEEHKQHLRLGKGTTIPLKKLFSSINTLGESDLLRYLQWQTGIQSGADGFGGLHVRGGNSDQNLVLLDGVPIYNPSHTLGLFSIFNTPIIKKATVLKDGFSAKYGGRLSSVIDVRMKEGSTKEWKTEGELSTLATKLSVEGPLIKEKTGLLLAFRRTHLDPLINHISKKEKLKDDNTGAANYAFFDVNAKIHHRFSANDRLFFSFYKGKDNFRDRNTIRDEFEEPDYFLYSTNQVNKINWGNSIAALRWNHLFGAHLFANTTLTSSLYSYNSQNADFTISQEGSEFSEDNYYTQFQSKIRDVGLKIDFEYYPSDKHQVRFGIGALYRSFKSGVLEVESTSLRSISELEAVEEVIDDSYELPHFQATELDVYIEDKIQLTKQLSVLTGLHLASFLTKNKNYISAQPRLSLLWQKSVSFSTSISGSRMSQFLHILTTSGSSFPNDLWVPSTKMVKPQEAWQVALTSKYNWKNAWSATGELFYKELNHLLAYGNMTSVPTLLENDPAFWEEETTRGTGLSYGFAFSLQKTIGKTKGNLSYNYTISERKFEHLNNGNAYPFRYTHPHEIKINLNHQVNKNITFQMGWHYGNGQPTTLVKSDSPFAPLDNLLLNTTEQIGKTNGFRLPAYHRLDMGIAFKWHKNLSTHALNLGIYNVYNRKNPYYVYLYEHEFFPEDNGLKQQNALPILPSISYRVTFE